MIFSFVIRKIALLINFKIQGQLCQLRKAQKSDGYLQDILHFDFEIRKFSDALPIK